MAERPVVERGSIGGSGGRATLAVWLLVAGLVVGLGVWGRLTDRPAPADRAPVGGRDASPAPAASAA
ncbi:MAG TPA: hypothetical protein VNJ28_07340, partial [Candidatus Limnocylindrales bacterium]|nr:hypothetical protein [Candidatus Limnocylindrales bacterium]